jgi:hypothetical protein
MTEINVIKRVDVDTKITKEEKVEGLEAIAAQINLADYHVQNFLSLERPNKAIRPEILSVLIRDVSKYMNVIPIVTIDPKMKNFEEFSKAFHIIGSGDGIGTRGVEVNGDGISVPLENKLVLNVKDVDKLSLLDGPGVHRLLYNVTGEVIVHGFLVLSESRVAYPIDAFSFAPTPINRISHSMGNLAFLHDKLVTPMLDWDSQLTAHNLSLITDLNFPITSDSVSGGKARTIKPSKPNKTKKSPKTSDKLIQSKKSRSDFPGVRALHELPVLLFGGDQKKAMVVAESLYEYEAYVDRKNYWDWLYTLTNVVSSAGSSGSDVVLSGASELYYKLHRLQDALVQPSVLAVSKIPEWLPGKLVLKFLDNVSSVMSTSLLYESSILLDIVASGLYGSFEKYIYTGLMDEAMVGLTRKIETSAAAFAVRTRVLDGAHTKAYLLAIYSQKFGREVSSLEGISARERSIIDAELVRQLRYAEAVRNNLCPHIAIERAGRHAESIDDKEYHYRELFSFMAPSDRRPSRGGDAPVPSEFIQCNNCKLDLICPHMRDVIALTKSHTQEEIRSHIFKYAGKTMLHDAYYCDVCGETITYNIEMEGVENFVAGVRVDRTSVEDALREYLTLAVTYVLGNVRFSAPQTGKFISGFVGGVVGAIYDFIAIQEKIINKSKTSTESEVEMRMQLFTDIYIFAFLIKVARDNPKAFTFVGRGAGDSGRSERGAPPLQKMFSQVWGIIMESRNILITKLNLDGETIQKSLYKAYSVLDRAIAKSKVVSEDRSAVAIQDPVNEYCISMKVLEALSKNSNADIDSLRGMHTRTPACTPVTIESDNQYAKYMVDSYNNFIEYIKSVVFTVGEAQKSNHLYIVSMAGPRPSYTYTNVYAAYFEKQTEWALIETGIENAMKQLLRRGYWRIPGYQRMDVMPRNDLLSWKYGVEVADGKDKFHIHKWAIWHYGGGGGGGKSNGKTVTLTAKEILELDPVAQSKLILMDVSCSICKLKRSTITKGAAPLEILEEEDELENFFNYYNYKCPEAKKEPYHVYADGSDVCKLCGIDNGIREDKSRTYYRKYKKTFHDDLKSGSGDVAVPSSMAFLTPADVAKAQGKYYLDLGMSAKSYQDWKFNSNIINEFANATYDLLKGTKIKKPAYLNLITNLGLSEGLDLDDIMAAHIAPYKNIETDDNMAVNRIARLGSYVHEFLISQNILRNYDTISEFPNLELKEVIQSISSFLGRSSKTIGITASGGGPKKSQKTPKFQKTPEVKKTKETKFVSEEYFGALENMQKLFYAKGQYFKIGNFMLDALLKMMLRLLRDHKELGVFVAYFIQKLVISEKSVSKMKDKKAAEISAAQIAYDSNMNNLVDNVGTKDFDGLVTEADLEKTIYSEMDYDGENDDF